MVNNKCMRVCVCVFACLLHFQFLNHFMYCRIFIVENEFTTSNISSSLCKLITNQDQQITDSRTLLPKHKNWIRSKSSEHVMQGPIFISAKTFLNKQTNVLKLKSGNLKTPTTRPCCWAWTIIICVIFSTCIFFPFEIQFEIVVFNLSL